MKKIGIIQTTILVIAVLNAYSLVEYIMNLLSSIAMASNPFSGGSGDVVVRLIITIAVLGAVYLLIRYSRRIALWLLKADPEGDMEGEARWDVDRRTLVFALFIGFGLFTLTDALVFAIRDLFDLFKYKVAHIYGTTNPKNTTYLELEFLRVALGAILIYASPTLTDLIEQKIAIRLKPPKPGVPDPEGVQAGTPDAEGDTQPS